jgi:hypothetical protein
LSAGDHAGGVDGLKPSSDDDLGEKLIALRIRVVALEKRDANNIAWMNTAAASINAHDKTLKSSQVFSASFWTRAWAIWGSQLAAGLIVYVAILLLAMFVGALGR